MADNSLEIQKAITSTLRSGVASLSSRVYDLAPQNPTFPYVSYGPALSEPYDGVGMDGWECLFEVHTWSRPATRDRAECQSIMSNIEQLLHGQVLTLDSEAFVNGRMVSSRTLADPDGVTVHGIQRFRFITGTA